MKKVHIVIGPARCGTFFYASELCKSLGAEYIGECNALWSRNISSVKGRSKIREFLSCRSKDCTIVEKTPSNALICDKITSYFPEYEYHAIIRHPFPAIKSTLAKMNGNVSKVTKAGELMSARERLIFLINYKIKQYQKGFVKDQILHDFHQANRYINGRFIWGPSISYSSNTFRHIPKAEIAAQQWLECVDNIIKTFKKENIVRYEDFCDYVKFDKSKNVANSQRKYTCDYSQLIELGIKESTAKKLIERSNSLGYL